MANRPSWKALLWSALILTAGLVLLALAATAATATFLPGCTSCHHGSSTFAAQTAASPHAAVPCVACHVAPGALARTSFAQNELFGMVLGLGEPAGRSGSAVSDSACLSCHRDVLTGTAQSNGLRIRHVACAKGVSCTSCHSTVAHGTATPWPRVPQMAQCTACHAASVPPAPKACDSCHVGSTPTAPSGGSLSATHGPGWKTTHGQGDLAACRSCHAPADCSKCHGAAPLPHPAGFVQTHGALGKSDPASCRSCHQPSFCDSCHGVPMPHPPGFTAQHITVVSQVSRNACYLCHTAEDCQSCHDSHIHPAAGLPLPKIVGF